MDEKREYIHVRDVERITRNMVALWKRVGWDSAGVQAMEMLKESIKDVVENQQESTQQNNQKCEG